MVTISFDSIEFMKDIVEKEGFAAFVRRKR
jgi:hypothetical protein